MVSIDENSFFPIAALVHIQIQLRLMQLRDKTAVDAYTDFANSTKLQLSRAYNLSLDDQEWLEEMVLPDCLVLEVLQTRMEKRIPLLQSGLDRKIAVQQLLGHLLLLLVDCRNGNVSYDSRLRALLKALAHSLITSEGQSKRNSRVNYAIILSLAENDYLFKLASDVCSQGNVSSQLEETDDNASLKKWTGIGLATVAGGLLVGVTGGLAVPMIAGGLSSLGVAGAGLTAFGSVASAAIVGSTLGVAGAGLAGFKISRHYQNLEEFSFVPITDVSPGLSYTIAIPGWLNSLDDGLNQFTQLTEINPMLEVNVLQYDRKALMDLTTAAEEFIKTNLIGYGVYGAAVAATGTFAVAVSFPITALQGLAMLDNPWNLALSKSETAGMVLARNVISSYEGGKRPVTLVGHGMGARVITYCLLELYKMRDSCDIYGMVDSVFLFGASVSLSSQEWQQLVGIVSSRFVNCYSENDWFLKILFRLKLTPAAGTAPIDIPGITNIDVSSLINSHGDYVTQVDDLLLAVGFEQQSHFSFN